MPPSPNLIKVSKDAIILSNYPLVRGVLRVIFPPRIARKMVKRSDHDE